MRHTEASKLAATMAWPQGSHLGAQMKSVNAAEVTRRSDNPAARETPRLTTGVRDSYASRGSGTAAQVRPTERGWGVLRVRATERCTI